MLAELGQGYISWDGEKEIGLNEIRAKLDNTSAGEGIALVQDLLPVTLTKEAWTEISDQMEVGKFYNLILGENESGWAVPTATAPAANQAGEIGVPIGDAGFTWSEDTPLIQYNNIPIWVWTSFGKDGDPAKVKILEVAQ